VIESFEPLRAGLQAAGLDPAHAERIARFGAHLLEVNRRLNLSGAETPEELLPHLLDSLTIVPYLRGRYVDVGSGGGLPAIPAAIAADVELTLIEAITKKAVFLEGALTEVGLEGRVLPERAEQAGRDDELREQFDCATARAVSTAPTVLEYLAPLLKVGGRAILQRGAISERERDAVTDAAMMLGCFLSEEVPLDGDRRLLICEKTSPTPQRFPRRIGVPEKRPLCL